MTKHSWADRGMSGEQCDRCGMWRYYHKGKRVFSLSGYRIKTGRNAKTPRCTG